MKVAFTLGLGLAAGTAGTGVLTVSEKIEQRLTGRASSTVPGQVGAAVAGSKDDEVAAQWLNTPVHWAHGTAWPWKWRKQELVTDLFHKAVYAIATSATFEPLRRATS